jgi:hypothetical protein
LVVHSYLYKLSEAEFDEYVKYLNRHFQQKFNVKSSNLRVRITSIHGEDRRSEPFMYFNHGKKPIKLLPAEINELVDLSSLSLAERHLIEQWFAYEKYQTILGEFVRDDLPSILMDRAESQQPEGEEAEAVDAEAEDMKRRLEEKGAFAVQTKKLFMERLAKFRRDQEAEIRARMPGGEMGPEKQAGPLPDEVEIKTQDYGQDWAKHERFARFVEQHRAGKPMPNRRKPKKYPMTPADFHHRLHDTLGEEEVDEGEEMSEGGGADARAEKAASPNTTTTTSEKPESVGAEEGEEASEELPQPDVVMGSEDSKGQFSVSRLPPGYQKVTQYHHKFFTSQEPFVIRFEITRMNACFVFFLLVLFFFCRSFLVFVSFHFFRFFIFFSFHFLFDVLIS